MGGGGGRGGKGYNSSLFPVPAASALQLISGLSCPPPPPPPPLPPLPQPPRAAVLWIKQWHVYTAVFSPPRSGTGGKSIARDPGLGVYGAHGLSCSLPQLNTRSTPHPYSLGAEFPPGDNPKPRRRQPCKRETIL